MDLSVMISTVIFKNLWFPLLLVLIESLLPKLTWKIITYHKDRRQIYEILTAVESESLMMVINSESYFKNIVNQILNSSWRHNMSSQM